MSTEAAALEIRNLNKRFGGVQAVTDLSLTVQTGTVLGVIGPNGAGKSTFINLVTGHLVPNSGQILVHGKDLTGARPWGVASAGVARTFQIVKPFRGMTVRENVAISAIYGRSRARSIAAGLAAADEVLERVGLQVRPETLPMELGVADARRLEFAKALAQRPRLLLLDEVLAGLRPHEIDPSLALIRELKQDGITVVVVEHLMRAILAVSDHVLVLHQGRRLTLGRPHEVLSDPRVIEAYLGQRYAQRRGG